MRLLVGLGFELGDSVEEVGRVLAAILLTLLFLELGVDGQDVVEAMDGVVLQSLLSGSLLIFDQLLFQYGETYGSHFTEFG